MADSSHHHHEEANGVAGHDRRIYRLESIWYGEGASDGARVMLNDLARDVAAIKRQRWVLWVVAACLVLMTLKMWFPALGGG